MIRDNHAARTKLSGARTAAEAELLAMLLGNVIVFVAMLAGLMVLMLMVKLMLLLVRYPLDGRPAIGRWATKYMTNIEDEK